MSVPKPVIHKDNEITMAADGEKRFAKDTSEKGLLPKIYKEHIILQ